MSALVYPLGFGARECVSVWTEKFDHLCVTVAISVALIRENFMEKLNVTVTPYRLVRYIHSHLLPE